MFIEWILYGYEIFGFEMFYGMVYVNRLWCVKSNIDLVN